VKIKIFPAVILSSLLTLACAGCVGKTFQPAPILTPLSTPTSTPLPVPIQGFGVEYRPELLISMKWGLAPDEIYPSVIRIPSSDFNCCFKAGVVVRFRPRFLHYIADDLRLYVLAVSDEFGFPMEYPYRFDLLEISPDGKLENRFHLRNTDLLIYNYRLKSFVVKDQYIYLHEKTNNGEEYAERIRKISLDDGKDVWQTRIDPEFSLESEYPRDEIYIGTDGNLYAFSWSDRILQLDSENGQVIKNFFLSKESGHIFLSPSGNFYSDSGVGRLNDPFISCNLQTGKCVDVPNPRSVEADLFGVDKKDNVYTRTFAHNKIRIHKSDGTFLAEFPLPSVVVKDANEIYFGFWDVETYTMLVRHWSADGQTEQDIQLSVPPGEPIQNSTPLAQLVQVNKDGYFIYGHRAALHHYDLTGKLVESHALDGENAAMIAYNRSEALFDFESVQTGLNMDQEGRIYLTIMDPEGFKVVRLDLVLPEEEAK